MTHPTRAASNTCDKCGHWLCDECASGASAGGQVLCKSCAAQSPPEAVTARPPRPDTNAGLLLILSLLFPPGANYMYMGLIKRGLAAMCAFFLLIFLVVASSGWMPTVLFALSIPVLWFASFFDGFNTRRRINAGEPVDDGIGDVIAALRRNKALTLIVIAIVGIALAGNILGAAMEIIRRAIPLILILLAVYIIFRKKG